MARFLIAEAKAPVAYALGLAAWILVPVDREAGLAGVLGATQQFRATNEGQFRLALCDFLGKAIDEILGHVAPGVAVEELPRLRIEPIGDALGWIAGSAEGR